MQVRFFLAVALSAFIVSCNSYTEQTSNRILENKIDSLSEKILSLEKQIDKQHQRSDTVNEPAPSSISKTKQKVVQLPTKPKVQTTPAPSSQIKENAGMQGSTFNYCKAPHNKVSVIVTPWENQKRKIILLNPFGDTTYICNDVRMSYTVTTHINKFHQNGAVDLITINNNPGASMYWTETQMTFDINNNPLWKTVIQKPETSLEESLNNKYWWNSKTKEWIKQEIVKE